MGVTTEFRAGENPVDVLTAFQAQAQKPYTAVYVKFGRGRHAFGDSEFHTMQEFADEIRDATKLYDLDADKFAASLTASTAIITFDNKRIYGQFMDAMLGKNVERRNFVVQISNQSREWHQAAGEFLAYNARWRREQNLPDSPVYQKNVAGFSHMLVDYTFQDIDSMKDFCAKVMSFDLRNRSQDIYKAGQPHKSAKPS